MATEFESVKPRDDRDEPPLPGWRKALMPGACVMASMTLTSPRSRSCSLVMMSRLAGVSNGVRRRNEPVAAVSSRLEGAVSPETETAGRVATNGLPVFCARVAAGASNRASAVETAVRRDRTDVLAERVGMESLGRRAWPSPWATGWQSLTEQEGWGARPERGARRGANGRRGRSARGDAQGDGGHRHDRGRRRQERPRGQRRAYRADGGLLGVLGVLMVAGLVGAFHPDGARRRTQLDQGGARVGAGHEALRHQRFQREDAQRHPDGGAAAYRREGAGGEAHDVAILNDRLQRNEPHCCRATRALPVRLAQGAARAAS